MMFLIYHIYTCLSREVVILMNNHFIDLFFTILASVIASTGFWNLIQKVNERKDAKTLMLLGLANDRIVYLSMRYLKLGNITHDEYDTLKNYLYEPYVNLGGNGTAERLMKEVDKLPIIDHRND